MKKFVPYLVLIVLTFFAFKPLLNQGFFPIHDDEQIARVYELDAALKDGQFPVRWVEHLGFGYGYPLFNFYPPLTYYSAGLFHSVGFSFIDSTKLVFLFGFLFSAFFMYLWVKDHFGELPGIFAAILYVYAPYHAVGIYVRGSMPDFFAYGLIPGIFWALDKLFKTQKVLYVLILGFLIASVPLTHILKIVEFTPFFVIYSLYLILRSKEKIKSSLLLSASIFLGIGLSAFFWIPAILEKNYTLVDKVNTGELFDYKLHFVYLRQFLNSAWGYGGSIFGLEDGFSFEIGKIQLFSSFISILLIVYFSIRNKLSEFKLPMLICGMFLLSVYMATFYSQWIWDRIQILSYLQFPWRFLTYGAVFSSFLGGFLIYSANKYFGKNLGLVAFVTLSSLGVILTSSNFQPQGYLKVNDNYYTNLNDLNWRVSKASFEFVPNGVATKLSDIKTTQVNISKDDIPKEVYKIVKGNASISVLSNKSHLKIFDVKSSEKSTLQVNTFSFPGWQTVLDGKVIKYSDNNKLKLITVEIPPGAHKLEVNFTNTSPRAIGNAISLVTIFNLLGFGLFRLWKK